MACRKLWKNWFLANTIGGILSWSIAAFFYFGISAPASDFLLGWIGVGIAQWIILRRILSNSYWWVLVTAAAAIISYGTAENIRIFTKYDLIRFPFATHYVIIAALGSTIVGIAQWLVLKNKVSKAFLWIPTNIAGAVLGMFISQIFCQILLPYLLSGLFDDGFLTDLSPILLVVLTLILPVLGSAIFAAITGSVLVRLLDHGYSTTSNDLIINTAGLILWSRWSLANTIGGTIGVILFWLIGMNSVKMLSEGGINYPLSYPLCWIGVGIAQWLILRKITSKSHWWLLATATGAITSYYILEFTEVLSKFDFTKLDYSFPVEMRYNFDLIRSNILIGYSRTVLIAAMYSTGVGIAQWLVLQRKVLQAFWWVPMNVIGALVGEYTSLSIVAFSKRVFGILKCYDLLTNKPVSDFQAFYCFVTQSIYYRGLEPVFTTVLPLALFGAITGLLLVRLLDGNKSHANVT